MLSIYIARQALHLVILLNDNVDTSEGPTDEQYEERITLEESVSLLFANTIAVHLTWRRIYSELIELSEKIKSWGMLHEGCQLDYEQRLPDIKTQYLRFFRIRFYFVGQ